jgi:hypothetical protein
MFRPNGEASRLPDRLTNIRELRRGNLHGAYSSIIVKVYAKCSNTNRKNIASDHNDKPSTVISYAEHLDRYRNRPSCEMLYHNSLENEVIYL